MVPSEKPIALVVDSADEAKKAQLELARIGFDKLVGYIEASALTQTHTLPQISVEKLRVSLKRNGPLVLDVRTPTEWQSNHIDGARHVPLSSFAKQPPDLPNDRPIAVICGSGYRSSIATSMLQARGHENVENVTGGMIAFTEADK